MCDICVLCVVSACLGVVCIVYGWHVCDEYVVSMGYGPCATDVCNICVMYMLYVCNVCV